MRLYSIPALMAGFLVIGCVSVGELHPQQGVPPAVVAEPIVVTCP